MSGKLLKDKAKNLALKKGSRHDFIRQLIIGGFFDSPVTTPSLVLRVREKFGKKLRPNHVQTYMQVFMREGIIQAVKIPGTSGNFWVLGNIQRDRAVQMIGGDSRKMSSGELLPDTLVKKMQRNFKVELADLAINYGRSGNCTAFLLRKILEKLIYISFARNSISKKLEDKTRTGGLVGLETMINIAASEKIHGIPFLTQRTAREIKGIKFLGDASAHNPLVDVDIRTIVPQMPFIITAYKELARHL